jgi:hypothetical protein
MLITLLIPIIDQDNDVLYEATALIFKCDRAVVCVSSIQDTCRLEGFNAVPEGLLKRPEFPAKRLQLLGTEWGLVAHLDKPAIGWGTKYMQHIRLQRPCHFKIHHAPKQIKSSTEQHEQQSIIKVLRITVTIMTF